MILIVDHYDSFTYNLVQLVESLGRPTEVVKSDAEPAEALVARTPDAVILSPGPGRPEDAGVFTSLLSLLPDETPVLGVCLGHQALGQAMGGKIIRAPEPMHGKLSRMHHTGKSVFRGLNNDFLATRYHSLTIAPESMPDVLEVTATSEDGVIQGVMHKTHPVHGVQFHPESIASENGHALLANFLQIARG